MADGIIILPPVSTTSGKIMDTSEISVGGNTVERERLVVSDPTAAAGFATVTTSAGLQVNISSGLITLSSNPTVVLSSAGISQVIPVTTSGINLYTTTGLNVQVMGSSGLPAPVTSSGGLLVSALSTGPYLLSSAGISQIIPVTSSGVNLYTTQGLSVQIMGSSGLPAPVTSSGGVLVTTLSSGPRLLSSAGITQIIPVTTSGINLYTTSGLIVQLSGSSGLTAPVTSSGGLLASVLSSGPILLSSAGISQIIPVTSSGINLYTTQGLYAQLMGSSGLAAPVTSSGGLLVSNITTGALVLSSVGFVQGLIGTSSGLNLYTTAGIYVQIMGSSGVPAPVTSSGGLRTNVTGVVVVASSAGLTQIVNVISATSGAAVPVIQSTTLGTPQTSAVPPWIATLIPISSGQMGSTATPFTYVSSSSTNSNNIKGSAGSFYGFYASNTTLVGRYLKIYNTTSAPTAGTTAAGTGFGANNICLIFGIPVYSTVVNAGNPTYLTLPYAIYASNGLGMTITANANATDTGVIGANDIALMVYYI